jgi:hypothetical protein
MIKKLSLLLTGLAALAYVGPSAANASAVTFPAGTLLAVGSTIELTGTNVIVTSTILGELKCENLNLVGTLTKNTGTTVEGSGVEETPFQEGCSGPSGAIKLTHVTITKLVTTGSGHTGTLNFDTTTDIGALTCTIKGTDVPFTYTAGGDAIVFTKAGGITSSPAACGTLKVDGTFTVETKVSGVQHAVILD